MAVPDLNQAPASDILPRDPVLADIVGRLVAAYQPERVYLFGSVARGDAGPDSDYDILLVLSDDTPPERLQSGLAYDILWGTGTAADVLVWTKTRFERRARVVSSLPATVLREGKLESSHGLHIPGVSVAFADHTDWATAAGLPLVSSDANRQRSSPYV